MILAIFGALSVVAFVVFVIWAAPFFLNAHRERRARQATKDTVAPIAKELGLHTRFPWLLAGNVGDVRVRARRAEADGCVALILFTPVSLRIGEAKWAARPRLDGQAIDAHTFERIAALCARTFFSWRGRRLEIHTRNEDVATTLREALAIIDAVAHPPPEATPAGGEISVSTGPSSGALSKPTRE